MTSPALIFDLDGTLADTAPDLLSATNAVLASQGLPHTDLGHLRHMVGFGAKGLIGRAMEAAGRPVSEAQIPALTEVFLAHYRAHICDGSHLFPGVAETLAELKQGGATLAVLTNKPHELAVQLLPKLGIDTCFEAVFGAGIKPYAKPDPRIFHDVTAAARNGGQGGGQEGGKAVMIGDSITDLSTARAAGVPCVLFSYGYTPQPAAGLGADRVLDDFTALPGALKELGLL